MMVNTQKIKEILQASIFEVFEKMFFVFLDPGDVKDDGEFSYVTSINFTGSMSGEVKVRFNRQISRLMAGNMLNLSLSEISEKIIEDCLKEATNMLTGNFLRRYKPHEAFSLSLPLLVDDLSSNNITSEVLTMDFEGEDGAFLEVQLTISDGR